MKLKRDSEVTEPLCKHATKWFLTGRYKTKQNQKSSLKEFQECVMLMINTENKNLIKAANTCVNLSHVEI